MTMKLDRSLKETPGLAEGEPLDVLFISEKALWPLDQGFKVHGSAMARALADLGLRVGLSTVDAVGLDGSGLHHAGGAHLAQHGVRMVPWQQGEPMDVAMLRRSQSGLAERARRRLLRYLAPDEATVAGVMTIARATRPHVVIGLGQHAPIYLSALRPMGLPTVWYAADDLMLFHLSCLRRESFSRLPNRLKQLAIHSALERLHLPRLSGAIGVSPRDAAWLKHAGGVRQSICIRNGVDMDRFKPMEMCLTHTARRLVFWGRLDFEPNEAALTWFLQTVWPAVRYECPHAEFEIAGRGRSAAVTSLARQAGVRLVGSVDDIQTFARGATAAVLPMRSGAGIKNKLLEAAAMGLPILASPQAVAGLAWTHGSEPFAIARGKEQWRVDTKRILHDTAMRARLSSNARSWVEQYHHWPGAAEQLRQWLQHVIGHPLGRKADATRHDSPQQPRRSAA